jgi:hypothetical protein
MSLDTVKPKGMLIESYDRLSQILIDPMEFESDPVQSAPVHALLSAEDEVRGVPLSSI